MGDFGPWLSMVGAGCADTEVAGGQTKWGKGEDQIGVFRHQYGKSKFQCPF